MITVYLTRHGQTVWNLDKRLQGSGNSDLTDHGVEQAEQLKKRVDGLKLDVIYTSPLERARKTANIIRGNRNIEIIEVDAFKEISFGEYEGHTEEELLKVGRGKEIKEIKKAIGDKVLKVIIETCYLDEDEKIKMCEIVTMSGSDFIKTSTGMGTGGATLEDIKLMKEHVGKNVKIKAAGGVKSISDAEKFIEAGAERLGTSSICKILKNEDTTDY